MNNVKIKISELIDGLLDELKDVNLNDDTRIEIQNYILVLGRCVEEINNIKL